MRFELAGDVTEPDLSEALNKAFGSKPFVYARDGRTVEVYAHTDERAGPLAKVLAGGRENSRSKALDKIEARLSEAMGAAGVVAKAEVMAAVGREPKAKYFLQKFIRTHSQVRHANGEPVPGVKNSTKAAASVYEQWRPQFSGRERRNAYHLLFSARARTDANAVMAAARAVLEERAPGYKFVLAHHKDTKHVHIHAMVQARSADGERLKFYKPDLAAWRETFAEKARENGIAMVATRRMDHAMTRPFTKEHAGAYSRAQSDPRYQVSAKDDRAGGGQAATPFGWAIPCRERRCNRCRMAKDCDDDADGGRRRSSSHGGGVDRQQFSAVPSRSSREGQPGPAAGRGADQSGQKSFLSHPGVRELNALIGDLNMAQTPLEMRRQMARVNQALDNMRETLPPAHQGQFEQYREEVNDKMHDRLARLQFERQQQRRGGGSGEPIPEREARGAGPSNSGRSPRAGAAAHRHRAGEESQAEGCQKAEGSSG
ncbi:relaxase/mobilization nuclease domain-containing protein (plasmid) [Mesorhizobium atlanticum]|uniref:relaxase/mobilization nuclease domain-containing protein n=1 Tax=Mesorhizobium atlanticum TaxID=2233532 RepID=UPI0037048777